LGAGVSLRAAVVLAVSVGLLGPGGYAVWHELGAERSAAEKALRADAVTLTDVMAAAMREPLRQRTPEMARPIAQAMFRDPRLVAIDIHYDDGQKFLALYRSVQATAATTVEKRPVIHAGQRVGTVEVSLTVALMEEALALRLRELLLTSGLALLISLALILYMLDRWVFDPVAYITRSATEFADQRLDVPIELPRSDELGKLAGALERMRTSLLANLVELEGKNAELKAYANTLEARVEQRTIDLTETNERLSASVGNLRSAQRSLIEAEKLASLGRLVASIAHELNTPLSNAMTVVTALEETHLDMDEKLAGGQLRRSEFEHFLKHNREGLEILSRNIGRSAGLIGNFKQVAVDQSSERRRFFELSVVIEDTLATIRPKLKRMPYVIHTELAEGLMMDSYPGPLEQVLINLIMNSVIHGFGERAYGSVTVRASPLEGERVRIVCADDGVGMEERVRARVFEPFFTTRADKGGSGLGMSIVYSIVTSVLGGRISLQSKAGEGTAVVIDLPRQPPEYRPDDIRPEKAI
jgi:C4-dicarboxylate-specific signal transduction histidine kinase